jgi:saccharopine dehydrogenase (NADP+, L-glutamate forming)/spermidine synthase
MTTKQQKSVLILGSGFCTPPLVRYLAEHKFFVILANRTLENAQKLVESLGIDTANIEPRGLDIEKEEGQELLEELAPRVDAVVSMLPYLFHPIAARAAMKHNKHFFTTSYATDVMRQLDKEAKEKGLIIINECGVDPGTDHMSAMKIIHDAKSKGGDVVSFTSFTGGLPAPDSNNNPFGYKLSWAPRGVLLASRNDAHYLKDGKDVDIPGKDLFDHFHIVDIEGVGKLEAYPNRNSTQYIDIYGIPQTQTMLRGTYRYPGWCSTIKKMADLGYLDLTEQSFEGKTYLDIAKQKLNVEGELSLNEVKEKVAQTLNLSGGANDRIVSNMEWIGLFGEKQIASGTKTYLDALCNLFKEKLRYSKGETDMIVMRHEFVVDYPDRKEYISSTLLDYGIPNGDSSMSRTVSLPVAIAVRLVLEGAITLTGLQIPIVPELYNPILKELEQLGIKFVEKVDRVERK